MGNCCSDPKEPHISSCFVLKTCSYQAKHLKYDFQPQASIGVTNMLSQRVSSRANRGRLVALYTMFHRKAKLAPTSTATTGATDVSAHHFKNAASRDQRSQHSRRGPAFRARRSHAGAPGGASPSLCSTLTNNNINGVL